MFNPLGNIGWTSFAQIVILAIAGFFLVIMLELLRNVFVNWGFSHPVISSLAAMIGGLVLWWSFGGIIWLGTPIEKSGSSSIDKPLSTPVQYASPTPAMSPDKEKPEIQINPRVTREEQDQIDEIFKNAPRTKIAVSSLSAKEGEEARPALEAAGWLKDALEKAGVEIAFTAYGNPEMLYEGATICWIKNAQNNEMVSRILKAAEIKCLHPREVSRPASKKCEIELMIGLNPYG